MTVAHSDLDSASDINFFVAVGDSNRIFALHDDLDDTRITDSQIDRRGIKVIFIWINKGRKFKLLCAKASLESNYSR